MDIILNVLCNLGVSVNRLPLRKTNIKKKNKILLVDSQKIDSKHPRRSNIRMMPNTEPA